MRVLGSVIIAFASLPGWGFCQTLEIAPNLALSEEERLVVARNPPARVAITPEWAPFSYFNAEGKPAGIDVDLLNIIAKRTGLRFEFIEGNPPWEEIWKMAQRGELDLTTSVVQTSDRDRVFEFTEPYSESLTVIVARGGDLRFPTLSQLRYATVALAREHVPSHALTNRIPTISRRMYDLQADCFRAVARRDADVTVVNLYTATQYLNDHPRDRLAICGAISEFEFPLRMAVTRNGRLPVSILNKGLATISREVLDEITREHLHFGLQASRRAALLRKRVAFVSGAALVLTVGFLLWHWQIKREVIARRSAEMELRELNRSLEVFSHSIAHDLRAPLRAINGLSEALQQDYGPQLDATAQDYLNRIATASARMEALVRDVLAYSQASHASFPLQTVSLQNVVDELLSELPTVQRKAFKVTSELPDVRAHPALLAQCLGNLFSNAVKFVPEGRRPEIRVWAEDRASRIRLWVQDNGIGISPGDQERIFKLFERGSSHGSGTGIGLAVVAKGIERMGGAVGVESQLFEGSSFWIELMKPS